MASDAVSFNQNKLTTIVKGFLEINEDLSMSDSLIDKGLDSMKSIRLVVLIEKSFAYEFDDSDLLMDNFITIDSIISIMSKKIDF